MIYPFESLNVFTNKKNAVVFATALFWRKRRDSNPRYVINVLLP